ncbi:glycine zipper domain-containing protein [Chloroflexota bacterium]
MSINSNMQLYVNLPPDEGMIRGEMEYRKEMGNKAPRRKPGDGYSILGALAGAIIGAILGSRTGNPFGPVIGLIVGGIAGIWIGSQVGNYITKYIKRSK